MNYFELFDLPVGFLVDPVALKAKYFALQKKQHPDFFTQGTDAEQSDALEQSAAANKALRIFKDPDATIAYVLQLKGVVEEGEKYQLPNDFLMEMMELNEELDAGSKGAVEAIEKELYNEVQPILTGYDDAVTPEADLLKVKDYYYKKKYLQRILDRLAG